MKIKYEKKLFKILIYYNYFLIGLLDKPYNPISFEGFFLSLLFFFYKWPSQEILLVPLLGDPVPSQIVLNWALSICT